MRDAPQLQPEATRQERDAEEARIAARANTEAADNEFTAQWGLGGINAQWAYARGATGDGVTIGVIDNGLDHLHEEVAGRVTDDSILLHPDGTISGLTVVMPRPPYPAGNHVDYQLPGAGNRYPTWESCSPGSAPTMPICQYLTVISPTGTPTFYRIPFARETQHGLGTTSVAVANKDEDRTNPGGNIHGVAYNSNVRFSIKHVLLGLGGIAVPIDDILSTESLLRPLIRDKIPVVNMSFGITLFRIDQPGFPIDVPLAELMEQRDTPLGERTVFVWAAGNDNGDACTDGRRGCNLGIFGNGTFDAAFPAPNGGLPYLRPNLRGHSLAVAATRQDNPGTRGVDEEGIADFSNRCGTLPAGWDVANHGRHYCLSAPGEGIRLPLPRGLQRISTPRSPCTGNECRYLDARGTSFAAPHVTGAIAVLIEFFTGSDGYQNVGNTAIVFRVLETANRKGVYSDGCQGTTTGTGDDRECDTYSNIYGAGLLDLKAATEPDGMAMMMTSGTLTGPAAPLSQTRLSAGPAYGDAFTRAFADTRVAAFDSMLFPFWHPLTSLVDAAPRRSIYYHRARFSPARRVSADLPGIGTLRLGTETLSPAPRRSFRPDADAPSRRRPSSLAFNRETDTGAVFASWRAPDTTPFALRESLPTPLSGDAFTHPFLAFAGDGITAGLRVGDLTAAAFTDPDAPSPVHGMALDYALSPYLSAQAGMLNEKGGALGLRPDGAFGGLGVTTTAFTGLKLDAPISPRWRALAHAHLGTARPDVGGVGLVKGVSSMLASAFSVGFAGYGVFTEADSLTLAVSQPLRVERGRVSLVVPTGRTPDGDLRRAAVDAGLEPSGREVAVSAAWTAALSKVASLRLAAGVARHPGHDGGAGNAFHALADVSFRF